MLKWPNDIFAGGKKLGGVLAEMVPIPDCGDRVAIVYVSARCLVTFGSYTVHVLSHRTNVIILLGIVMETFGMEWVGSITRTLFFMEVIVLNEGFYPILLHESVIFFRTVTGVCHTDIR